MVNSERVIDKSYFEDLKFRIRHNYQIADFYLDMYEETGRENFLNKSKVINVCCKYWDLFHYVSLKVKNIKRVNLCKDKFCFNCQKLLAEKRQQKYEPILNELRKDYEVFHMVVTVPNCEREELLPLLNKMYKKFPYMLEFFKGKRNVRNIDFLQYGYGGAVRGLEVTQNQSTKQFHPHFHCMILFEKGFQLQGEVVNPYSFDDGRIVHKFSKLEILLQKIWFLLMNDERVTAKAIEELKLGYDIQMSDSEGHYHEAFKYACKGAFDPANGAFIYNEQTFRTLYEALNNRRMIQGYGALHNFDDMDGDILDDEATEQYEKIISALDDFEKPLFQVENIDEVVERSAYCKYISKSNIKRLLSERREEIEAKHILFSQDLDDFDFD